MTEPTALDLAVVDLAAARTAVDAARTGARAALAHNPTEATAAALAGLSSALGLVEVALATLTDVLPDDLDDVDDLVVDPSTASWSRLVLGRSA